MTQENSIVASIQFIAMAIVALLVIDVFGFFGWAMSGQRPADNFYVGTITTHVLQEFIR